MNKYSKEQKRVVNAQREILQFNKGSKLAMGINVEIGLRFPNQWVVFLHGNDNFYFSREFKIVRGLESRNGIF